MSALEFQGRSGAIRLGRQLGKGGEGAVHEIVGRPDRVAKIYLGPVSAERAAKLEAMEQLRTDELDGLTAWPLEVLRVRSGRVAGFVMPNLHGSKDIHRLYSPKSRLQDFPQADWRMLLRAATNTARAFAALHARGCLVADVNFGGVRVAPNATVRLIDCDSFQVSHGGRTYLCEVGVPDFTPPELQGAAFRATPRTVNHDAFGLAVLVFQVLMMGRHPFAGRFLGRGDMDIPRAIREFRYAFAANAEHRQMRPPPHSAPVLSASRDVATLWERAFGPQGATHGRPSAAEWVRVLAGIEARVTRCARNSVHYYLRDAGSCPWCAIESVGIVLFGAGNPVTVTAAATRDLAGLRAALARQVIPPLSAVPVAPGPVRPSAAAQATGRERLKRRWGSAVICVVVATVLYLLAPALAALWLGVTTLVAILGMSAGSALAEPFVRERRVAKAELEALLERRKKDEGLSDAEAKVANARRFLTDLERFPTERSNRLQEHVATREKEALTQFLHSRRLRDASIAGIGPAKFAALQGGGIHSAWDVSRGRLHNIRGIGPELASRILAWRDTQRRSFTFDRKTALNRNELAAFDRREIERLRALEAHARDSVVAAERAVAALRARRDALDRAIGSAAARLAQAEADISAL